MFTCSIYIYHASVNTLPSLKIPFTIMALNLTTDILNGMGLWKFLLLNDALSTCIKRSIVAVIQ